ncbi:MAG TPA: protein kinase [Vicinamibacterales bacterium]|nr:protein kinase [Vicinamibacterales bacterium]
MIGDDRLQALAAWVADGIPVDWQSLESQGLDEERHDLEQLQVIAEIADLHRRLVGSDLSGTADDSDTVGKAESEPPDVHPPVEARRWGPLLIREKLGAGSFGDVYRAWDTRLHRDVALKLLRRHRSSRKDAIVREGQLLARVSHANVMAVYGAEDIDGDVGIWGELLHGRTLARIVQDEGPLSAEETLVVAEAICRALAAAHKAGLLHRDVKAQNVIREKGGRIVLADFGLGRDLAEATNVDLAGTPLYLAPELLAGGTPSVQSDLYSLGVLMFYLTTASFPVTGVTVEGLAANHARGARTRLEDLRPDLPKAFVHVVDRALAPGLSERFTSAGAMHEALMAASVPARAGIGEASGRSAARRWLVPAGIAAVVALGGFAAGWDLGTRSNGEPPSARLLAIEPPPGTRLGDSSRTTPAISPDGRYIAIPAADRSTGKIHLWIHSLESAAARLIPDSERALAPFWSPDSRMLGFFEPGGTIKRVNLEGVALGHTPTSAEPRGAAWSSTGVLVYSKGPRSGLYARALPTGNETRLMEPDRARGELAYMWPHFLPDGDRFIYFVLSNDRAVRGLYLASVSRPHGVLLVNTDASGIVFGDALVYVRGGNLVTHALDPARRGVVGAPVVLAENVGVNFDWRSLVSGSTDGTLVYLPAWEWTTPTWFGRDGRVGETLNLPRARYRSPALSRDGQLLAIQRYRDGLSEIQVVDLRSGQTRPPLAHSADVQFPVWGPGRRLAYASIDTGRGEIYVTDFDRDDPPVRLPVEHPSIANSDKMPTDWSPDGEHLLVTVRPEGLPYAVWAVPVANTTNATPLRPADGTQVSGRFSPDGRRALYIRQVTAERDGDPPDGELWACDFPSGAHPTLLVAGSRDPVWLPTGEISAFVRSSQLALMVLLPGARGLRPLAHVHTAVNTPEAARNNYTWAPDGSRVLVNQPEAGAERLRLLVLLNAAGRSSGVRRTPVE